MDKKIQDLTDKIYREGVEKGNAEAKKIVDNARKQESQLVAEAQKQAARIVADAEKKAADLQKNTQAELRLFAGQAVEALKSEIADLITDKLAAVAVSSATSDPAFMQKMVLTIVEEWAKNDVPVIRTADADALRAYFEANAKALLQKGVKIEQVNGLKTAFEIVPADGSYKLTFGDEAFVNYFKAFLRPQLVEMLF